MPIYLYSCPTCDLMLELLRDRSQVDQVVTCPECLEVLGNEVKMNRIITAPQAIIFKGKGFYSTDNPLTEKIHKKRKEEENER